MLATFSLPRRLNNISSGSTQSVVAQIRQPTLVPLSSLHRSPPGVLDLHTSKFTYSIHKILRRHTKTYLQLPTTSMCFSMIHYRTIQWATTPTDDLVVVSVTNLHTALVNLNLDPTTKALNIFTTLENISPLHASTSNFLLNLCSISYDTTMTTGLSTSLQP